jgi:hypothetical protein
MSAARQKCNHCAMMIPGDASIRPCCKNATPPAKANGFWFFVAIFVLLVSSTVAVLKFVAFVRP